MTDAEAQTILYEMRYTPHPKMGQAIHHALQALADRAALVVICEDGIQGTEDDDPDCLLGMSYRATHAARRHMRGEGQP